MTSGVKIGPRIAIAIGSNIGDRKAALKAGVEALAPYVTVTAKSDIYETAPVYVTDQPAFFNAALIGETKLEPLVLLRALKQIESDLGRQPTFRYGPRLLDLDIIFYGDQIVKTVELTIPHPRMHEREFVLRPLADIASDWRHPVSGKTIAEMLPLAPSLNAVCVGPL